MRVFKWFSNLDKEEKWLNGMAKQGHRLISKSFGYRFERAVPEDANIRIDYRQFRFRNDYDDYLTLFADCGWMHIAGTKGSGSQYFKYVGSDCNEQLFSDVDSKAARYKRMSDLWLMMGVSFIPIATALFMSSTMKWSDLLNPKGLYYTPGLWDRTGTDFLWGFLFETPFVFFRGMGLFLIPAIVVLYFIFAIKAKNQYKKCKSHA